MQVCEPLLKLLFGTVSVFFVCLVGWLVILPSVIPKLPTHPPVRGVAVVWKPPLSRFPPQDRSMPKSFVSLFIFILCPTLFRRDLFAFWGVWSPLPACICCFVKVAPHDVLMYLWGRKWSPHPSPLPSYDITILNFFK